MGQFNIGFVQAFADRVYPSLSFDWIRDLGGRITTAAQIIGVSAGSVAGIMAEERKDYLDKKVGNQITDWWAKYNIESTEADALNALLVGPELAMVPYLASLPNRPARTHAYWVNELAQVEALFPNSDDVPSSLDKLKHPSLMDVGYGNFRIRKAVKLLNDHPEMSTALGLDKYRSDYAALVNDMIDSRYDVTAKLYAIYMKEAEDWFKSKNAYNGKWDTLPTEFKDALLVTFVNLGEKKMTELMKTPDAMGYQPSPGLLTAGGMNHLLNISGIGSALGLSGYGDGVMPISDMASLAKTSSAEGLATRYALRSLRSVVLPGLDYSPVNADGQLDLYDAQTGVGTLTESWITDRAAMLSWVAKIERTKDTSLVISSSDELYFLDYNDAGGVNKVIRTGSSFTGDDSRRHFVFGGAGADTLNGASKSDHLYAGAGADTLNGKDGDDYLEGNADNDTLDGGDGNDTLLGGSGVDIYTFSGQFGKDRVLDSDAQGSLQLDAQRLSGGQRFAGLANQWKGKDASGALALYTVLDDPRSTTGKTLRISRFGDTANTITLTNFDLSLATASDGNGYMGIKLDNRAQLALVQAGWQGGGGNFWSNIDAKLSSLADKASTLAEGAGKAFTIYLNQAAKAGETLVLNLAGAVGEGLQAILGDSVVDANGAVITLAEGQTQVSFALVNNKAIDAEQSGSLSVTYQSGDGSVSNASSNSWGLTLKDSGEVDHTIKGDSLIKLSTATRDIYRIDTLGQQIKVVSAGDTYYQRDAQGNLVQGGDKMITANVIFGSAQRDKIEGLFGNDLLDGGAGADVLDGGEGDDLIAGGAGADSINGGAGNDYIASSAWASAAAQQWGSNDQWSRWGQPADKAVLGNGDTWGVYRDSPELTVWSGIAGLSTQGEASEGDVIKAGAGDDQVLGSWAADRIAGEDGNDTLQGLAGDDIIEGGAGDDLLHGDGVTTAGYLSTVDAPHHGQDFLDGGEGQDVVIGDGGADQLFGGDGDDHLYGDSGAASSSASYVALANQGDDYIDGENGNDYAEGNKGSDTLYGGSGNDMLWGDQTVTRLSASEGAELANWGDDYLDGEEGNDTIVGGGGSDQLFGGAGSDQLEGDESGASLDGRVQGQDYLDGEDGNDTLIGGGNDDTLYGGTGNDTLWGDDRVTQVPGQFHGNDSLDGGDGDDTLIGGGLADVLTGGAGMDYLVGDSDSGDLAAQYQGADTLDGGAGNDTLVGGGAGDSLSGGAGDDFIIGDDLNSDVVVAAGMDTLEGGIGNDVLSGGGKSDTYIFNLGDGNDTVQDSNTDGDVNRIVLNFTEQDISFVKRVGVDLLIAYGAQGENSIKVTGYYSGGFGMGDQTNSTDASVDTPVQSDIVEINFADGVVWDTAHILSLAPPDTLSVDPLAAANLPYFVNALLDRDQVKAAGKHTLSFSFAETYSNGENGFHTFTDAQKNSVRAALSKFSATLDLSFNEVASAESSDLRFIFDDLTSVQSGAFAGYANAGTGEIHLNSTLYAQLYPDESGSFSTKKSLEPGQPGFEVILHEVGHALGLKHPFEAPVLPGAENSNANTVMSYTRVGDPRTDLAMFDVAALQYLYGVAQGQNAGDDVYTFANRYVGDAGGVDTWDASAQTQDVSINLSPGSWQYSGAKEQSILAAGQAFIGFGSQIENAKGGASNDSLTGNGAANVLEGGAGADTLAGGAGNDTLVGGEGADTYVFDAGGGMDVVSDSGRDNRIVINAVAAGDLYAFEDAIYFGTDGVQVDLTTVAELVVNGVTYRGAEIQTMLNTTGVSGAEDLVLTGEQVRGRLVGSGDWRITGNELGNSLTGNAGDNTLDGGSGADTLMGGAGNDTYVVDAVGDVVTEEVNAGVDTVNSGVTYTLGANIENLTLTGTAALSGTGNALGNRLTGNAGDNVLDGGAGSDIFRGGAGNDTLVGGSGGHNTYLFNVGDGQDTIVDTSAKSNLPNRLVLGVGITPASVQLGASAADLVIKLGVGTDQVTVKNYVTGSGIDRIEFANGEVWAKDDILTRLAPPLTQGNDTYSGTSVSDTINGLGGNDTISGESGNDLITGGAGNDILYGDDNIGLHEPLFGIFGPVNFSRTGNDQLAGDAGDDLLFGGLGNDTLAGGSGRDVLYGGAGDDTYIFGRGDAQDTVSETRLGGGMDTLALGDGIGAADVGLYRAGNNLVVVLDGSTTQLTVDGFFSDANAKIEKIIFTDGAQWDINEINSRIIAGSPNAMTGTAGDDIFVVDDVGDSITEGVNQGVDTVQSSVTWTLGANQENLLLTGALSSNGTGNDLNNWLKGNFGNNVLNGLAGVDTLEGGLGNDIYDLSSFSSGGQDVVIEKPGEGVDQIIADRSYTLPDNLENLTIHTGYIYKATATGNSANNVIEARYGDVIDGKGGDDTIIFRSGLGYASSSYYPAFEISGSTAYVDSAGDKVIVMNADQAAESRVVSSIDWVLGAGLGFVELAAGSQARSATGNELNNIVIGNANNNVLYGMGGNDRLYGMGGADTLIGGVGDDDYYVDNGQYAHRFSIDSSDAYGIYNRGDGIFSYQTDEIYNPRQTPLQITVQEQANEGIDTIHSIEDFTLGSNFENLVLEHYVMGWQYGVTQYGYAERGTGNALNNIITGNNGSNLLDGQGGNDTLIGGLGNDRYRFGLGYGLDRIIDQGSDSNTDTVLMGVGIRPEDVSVALVGTQVVLSLNANDQLAMDWIPEIGTGIERIEFTDGTVWQVAALIDPALHAPVVQHALSNQSIAEDTSWSWAVPADTFADRDTQDVLTYRASLDNGQSLPAWLSFDSATRTFSGQPGNGDVGVLSLYVQASDGSGLNVSSRFSLTVTNTNDAPVVAQPVEAQLLLKNTPFHLELLSSTFTDVDAGDSLSWSATQFNGEALPAWLSFDAATHSFSGTPAGSADSVTVKVTATDGAGACAVTNFAVEVCDSNVAPILTAEIANQAATEDTPWSWTVPTNAFVDTDAADRLTYHAQLANGAALPAWLSFDASTCTFSGTPANANVGSLALEVTATDRLGLSVSGSFTVTVANTNDAPTLLHPVPQQIAPRDSVFQFVLPVDTFVDVDAGDQLSYSTQGLPTWLTFDAATRTFSGQHPGSAGSTKVRVVVTDESGATASHDFDIVVEVVPGLTVMGSAQADSLTGARGDDMLSGLAGNDTLNGGAGNDALDAGAGDDVLDGGTGNDLLMGGAGADTYLFGVGSGQDRIINDDAGNVGGIPSDTIVLGSGITASDVIVSRAINDDLVISLKASTDSLRVVGYFRLDGGTRYAVETIRFADGTQWDVAAVKRQSLTATAGSDVITGFASDDLISGGDGNDILYGQAGADALDGGNGIDELHGGDGSDLLQGQAGNDRLYGDAGADTLDGGAGDDFLQGNMGADTYLFGIGSGHDTINNWDGEAIGTNADTIVLGAGITTSDVTLTRNNDDLLIHLNASSDRLSVLGYFQAEGTSSYAVERLQFSDGTSWDVAAVTSHLKAPNQAPVVTHGLADLVVDLGLPMNYQIPSDTFTDFDVGDTLTYSAQLFGGLPLPTWLNFDAETRSFRGVPQEGYLQIVVTATDAAGGMASSTFGFNTQVHSEGSANNDTLIGGSRDDTLYGHDGNDLLLGNGGWDYLAGGAGVDTMVGGSGGDWYDVDDVGDVIIENGTDGIDGVNSFISYTLGDNLEMLQLTGRQGEFNSINGTGNALDNTLYGNSGDNRLDGGVGADTLYGNGGIDTFVVDNVNDVIQDYEMDDGDVVEASLDWTLGQFYFENLTLTGSSNLRGTGNWQNNILTGNSGDNRLDGASGADVLIGRSGNDTYVVDNESDSTIELANDGVDTVESELSWTLGANLENLSLMGTGSINGVGNALDNVIIGNASGNVLDGNAGNDTLDGGGGYDYYHFGRGDGQDLIKAIANPTGSDFGQIVLKSGVHLQDITAKRVGEDLEISINSTSDKLQVEKFYFNEDPGNYQNPIRELYIPDDGIILDVAGLVDLASPPNQAPLLVNAVADQAIYEGNTLSLILDANTFVDPDAGDLLTYSATLANGSALPSWLHFNAGTRTLTGTAGASNLGVTSILVRATDIKGLSATDIFNVVVTSQNKNLVGTSGADVLTGASGNDTLDGLAGADTMTGAAGNDTYYVDNVGDLVVEAPNAGVDEVVSSITWTLPSNVENLTLIGSIAINGTGNSLANRLIGNIGDNILSGGAGADTLVGGAGNDVYVVDAGGDVVTELANEGVDTVQSTITYAIGANVENLILTGAGVINGMGNALDNVLTGNGAANVLTGGAGNDTYVVGAGDTAVEAVNAGIDTVQSAIAWTLAANVENLTLTGTAAVNGVGNSLDNVLLGNSGANTLTGNSGNDTLDGKSGADILVGGAGNDTYLLGRGYGVDSITENDTAVGNTDVARFDTGIATDQLWFSHVGNNLEVSIIGTVDKFVLSNWYLGNQYHVEQFKTSNGKTLLDSQVQNLVSAMAAFSPPAAGQITLPTNYAATLSPVMAANWK